MPIGTVEKIEVGHRSDLGGESEWVVLIIKHDTGQVSRADVFLKDPIEGQHLNPIIGAKDIYALIGKRIRYNLDDIGVVTGIQVTGPRLMRRPGWADRRSVRSHVRHKP